MSREISGHTYTDIHELWQWCTELEARQRAYGMHDPECPTFKAQQAQQHTGAHIIPPPCVCWLSDSEQTPTRYAFPRLVEHQGASGVWYIEAAWEDAGQPHSRYVGQLKQHDAGWTAHAPSGAYVGLYPDQHEAAKVLVKKAGYELSGQ